MAQWLIVKNWSKFQHYKKRNPPWIRFYRSTLFDHELACLSIEARMLAPLLWLLASESNGRIKHDASMIAFRVAATQDVVTKGVSELIKAKFLAVESDDASILEPTSSKVSHSVSVLSVSEDGGLGEGEEPAAVISFEGQAFQGLPSQLDTALFRAAWLKWEKYYHRIRGVMQPLTRINVWTDLLPLGPAESAKRINEAISKGWKSIVTDPQYESKFKNRDPPPAPKRKNYTEERLKAQAEKHRLQKSGITEAEIDLRIAADFGRDVAEIIKKLDKSPA